MSKLFAERAGFGKIGDKTTNENEQSKMPAAVRCFG
jgi:hypothetical protein